jgi:hypothetical protein
VGYRTNPEPCCPHWQGLLSVDDLIPNKMFFILIQLADLSSSKNQYANLDCIIQFNWQNVFMKSAADHQKIYCQQVLVDDASVFSIQKSTFPRAIANPLDVEKVMLRYLDYIRKCTASIIRPRIQEEGIEFRLLDSKISLISFMPPMAEHGGIVLRICGGFLVQPRQCERGELRFRLDPVPDGVQVSLQLSDFCPLILGSQHPSRFRYWLYRLTQAAIHRLVTVRFLVMLYRDLAGSAARVRVVSTHVRDGKPL